MIHWIHVILQSFITCNLGMWMVSLMTLPSAVVNAITAFSMGRLVKHTGVIPVFISGWEMK